MWNFTEDQWRQEILSSLKKAEMPAFAKTILTDSSIFPFSFGTQPQSFQPAEPQRPFLAIQNFDILQNSQMREWIEHPDVGFRFRQLDDISLELIPLQKTFFLSQPFPFSPSPMQAQKIENICQQGHRLNLGWSPLSFGLTRGEILKKPFAGWESIFKNPSLQNPALQWFYLSSAPYQWAGAEPHMELGILLSLAFTSLKELDHICVPVRHSLSQFSFGLALGTDVLVESSKICALKILWSRLTELVSDEVDLPPAEIYALPSLRFFSGRDTLNNLLRMTLMALSAGIGGARGFKCIPYDVLSKNKNKESFRVSTNVPLLLKQEGHIAAVTEPLNGSPLFDQTTRKICEQAWMFFQEIEKKGGIFEAVRTGWLQMELKRVEEFSRNQLCYFQKELVGVNKYVTRRVQSSPTETGALLRLSDIIDPLFLNKSPDDYLTVEPLLVNSVCYDWDVVQIKSDQYFQKHGKSPQVKMIKGGGPVVEKRIAWFQQVLSIAGIDSEVISGERDFELPPETPLLILFPSQDEMEEMWVSKLRPQIRGRFWSFGTVKNTSQVDKFLTTDVNALELIKEIQSMVLESV